MAWHDCAVVLMGRLLEMVDVSERRHLLGYLCGEFDTPLRPVAMTRSEASPAAFSLGTPAEWQASADAYRAALKSGS